MLDVNENGGKIFSILASLKDISIAALVSAILKCGEIQDKIVNTLQPQIGMQYIRCSPDELQEIEDKIISKIKKLYLPKTVNKLLLDIVRPMCWTTNNWVDRHSEFINGSKELRLDEFIKCITWTSKGFIDHERTARTIIAQKLLPDRLEFTLACDYCLEDEILLIAPKILATGKPIYVNSNSFKRPLECFWAFCLTRPESPTSNVRVLNDGINGTTFDSLLLDYSHQHEGNPAAIKYFWSKLGQENRVEFTLEIIREGGEWCGDLLVNMLTQLTKEQQEVVFRAAPGSLLSHLYKQLQTRDLFLPTLNLIWDYIICDKQNYWHLILILTMEMDKNHFLNQCNEHCRFTLKKLWEYSPDHLKTSILEQLDGTLFGSVVIFVVLQKENVSLIRFLLKDVSPLHKKNMINSIHGIEKCKDLFKTDECDLVETIIPLMLSTEEDIADFRNAFVQAEGYTVCVYLFRRKEFHKVDEFLKLYLRSEREISNFKNGLLMHSNVCCRLVWSLVKENGIDLMELEEALKVFCETREDLDQFRFVIRGNLFREKFFIDLLLSRRHKVAKEIFNWCFFDSEAAITLFQEFVSEYISESKDEN